jgi:hypothetical protein
MPPPAKFSRARSRGAEARLGFAREIGPEDAWEVFATCAAELVDVRTVEERKFVGYVPQRQALRVGG